MSTVEGEAVARQASSFALQFVMDDRTWRLAGFRRRPRRGAFFDRFISPQRLDRETALLREFLCLALAAMTRWVFRRSAEIDCPRLLLGRILELSIEGIADPVWPVLRFKTREEAVSFTSDAVSAYVEDDSSDQGAGVFHQRISHHLNDSDRGVWLSRSVMLCAGPQSVLGGEPFGVTELRETQVALLTAHRVRVDADCGAAPSGKESGR